MLPELLKISLDNFNKTIYKETTGQTDISINVKMGRWNYFQDAETMNRTTYNFNQKTNISVSKSEGALSHPDNQTNQTFSKASNPVEKLKSLFGEIFTTISDINDVGRRQARETETEIIRRVGQLEAQQNNICDRLDRMEALESKVLTHVMTLQTTVEGFEEKLSWTDSTVRNENKNVSSAMNLENQSELVVAEPSNQSNVLLLSQTSIASSEKDVQKTESTVQSSVSASTVFSRISGISAPITEAVAKETPESEIKGDSKEAAPADASQKGAESLESLRRRDWDESRWDAPAGSMTIGELMKKLNFPVRNNCDILSVGDCMSLRRLVKTRLGRIIEPVYNFNERRYCIDDRIVLIFDNLAFSGSAFSVSSLLFDLGFKLAIADNELLNVEIETIYSFVCNAFHLTQPEKDRLIQRGLLYKQTWDVDINYLIPKLKFNPIADDLICDFLIAVAAADNIVKDSEYKLLLDFYRQLGLTEQKLQERLNLLKEEDAKIKFQTPAVLKGSNETKAPAVPTAEKPDAAVSVVEKSVAKEPLSDKDNVYKTVCIYHSTRQRSLPVSELSNMTKLPFATVESCLAELLKEKKITRWGDWITPIESPQKSAMPPAVSVALGVGSKQNDVSKKNEESDSNAELKIPAAYDNPSGQEAQEKQGTIETSIKLDPKKLAAIQENTSQSQYYLYERLSSDRTEDEYANDEYYFGVDNSETAIVQTVQTVHTVHTVQTVKDLEPDKVENPSQAASVPERLARVLVQKSRWTELELKSVCKPFNLRVSNALDLVNEWTDDEFGDYLVDTDKYSVDEEISKQIRLKRV